MPARYRYVKRKHHPLAPPSGRLPEHRVILYEKLGPGVHPCHRCGKMLSWFGTSITADGVITTDHLDGDTWNNDPSNLEPACHTCNVIRARDARFENTPFLVINGKREAATERVCETCVTAFLIPSKHIGRKGKGRFCSQLCMANRDRSRDVRVR